MSRLHLFAAFALLAVTMAPLSGQTVVTNPILLSLQPEAMGDTQVGGEQFYKYGIYASLGGSSTPQLYEFDTGAGGFYAVYSTNPAYDSSGWGTNTTFVSTNGNISYVSSNDYVGDVVGTSVSLYSADGAHGYQATPLIATGNAGSTNVVVGQVLSISNSKTGSVSWPGTNAPPVEGRFYGDFGAALTSASNGIMNVLAQLNYSNGVIPGFVISLGTNGSTNPTLQIGITSNQLSQYTYRFQINGSNSSSPFPVALGSTNVLPTYAEGVISPTYSFANSNNFTWTNTGPVVLDTGATGFLRNDTNSGTLDPIISGGSVSNGVSFNLSLSNSNGTVTMNYAAMTGTNSGDISFLALGGTNYALNIGQDHFHLYDVAYDLQDGIIAFQPIAVPEAAGWRLIILGGLLLAGLTLLKRRSSQG